jgi:hypothetical protein
MNRKIHSLCGFFENLATYKVWICIVNRSDYRRLITLHTVFQMKCLVQQTLVITVKRLFTTDDIRRSLKFSLAVLRTLKLYLKLP